MLNLAERSVLQDRDVMICAVFPFPALRNYIISNHCCKSNPRSCGETGIS